MIVVRGETNTPVTSAKLAQYFEGKTDIDGYLYLGYPIIGVVDGGYQIDALLISEKHGAVVFHLFEGTFDPDINTADIQDESYTKFESKLKQHKELTQGRDLAVTLTVPVYAPVWTGKSCNDPNYPILTNSDDLDNFLESLEWSSSQKYSKLVSVIQSITTIRRRSKRNTIKPNSRGTKLKSLEESIANLDRNQSTAVIETVEGVQRIRGLAGSGKTIVLALKVAYLHSKNPDWNIAVTFNSRSLKKQLQRFITLFTLEHINEEPDWSKIDVIHAWGSPSIKGLYSEICMVHNIEYFDFKAAAALTPIMDKRFDAVCEKAYDDIKNYNQLYDVVLIDEAQDFSPYFLRLCYNILKKPNRLVYAYDELQNISNKQMPSPEELFGLDPEDRPIVSLENAPGSPKQDIVLNVCYRNPGPILATAHALGFGIYREKGLIQMFDQHQLWKDVGYKVKRGTLQDGCDVTLYRDNQSSPEFLEAHSEIDDLISFHALENVEEQASFLVDEIVKNINEDELKLNDIMVIHPDPLTLKRAIGSARSKLFEKGINSNLAGITTTPDDFFDDDAIVFTQIYRAKGNEASMVYIINADECFNSANRTQKRNMLFTALTRSKAWVRVIGVGPDMQALKAEFEKVKSNKFELSFKYPTEKEREKLSIVNRDMSTQSRNRLLETRSSLEDLAQELQAGDIHPEDLRDLPEDIRKQLIEALK